MCYLVRPVRRLGKLRSPLLRRERRGMFQTDEPSPLGHGQRVNCHPRGLLCCSKGENTSEAPLKAGVRPPSPGPEGGSCWEGG